MDFLHTQVEMEMQAGLVCVEMFSHLAGFGNASN